MTSTIYPAVIPSGSPAGLSGRKHPSPQLLAEIRQKVSARQFEGDIDGVLSSYGRRAQVVILWRQTYDTWRDWTYLTRLSLAECDRSFYFTDWVMNRFGGGSYKARIFGPWSRRLRAEPYLEQVSFGIAGPMSPESLERVRARMRLNVASYS